MKTPGLPASFINGLKKLLKKTRIPPGVDEITGITGAQIGAPSRAGVPPPDPKDLLRVPSPRGYWKSKSLRDMSPGEWELLCDGCGKCCVYKIRDEKNGEVQYHYTKVCCRLFDQETCRCTSYANRQKEVSLCMILTPSSVEELYWLPKTCAYRLLSQGQDLPWWHHLVSGDPDLIHRLGFSVKGKVIPEKAIHFLRLRHYIVQWD